MRRPLLLGATWLASAGAAVGLGFLAVSLVGASAAPVTTPTAATDTTVSAPPTGTQPGPASATGEYATVGGTIFANCTGGSPVVAGVPAAGWWVDDSDDPGEVEFENGSQKVEVHVTCVDGSPQFFDEGVRGDDGRHDDDSSTSPSSPTSGRDDDRHGDDDHGGDDRIGADNSGRGSSDSGHGGDDSGGDDSGRGSDD